MKSEEKSICLKYKIPPPLKRFPHSDSDTIYKCVKKNANKFSFKNKKIMKTSH